MAFGAATGVMPLDMPESVLVRFKGKMQPGITLRDLVHAIPYYAIQQGLLTVAKQGKKNEFSGRILEIEGLPGPEGRTGVRAERRLAERSAAGCTVKLNKPIIEYLNSNIVLMKNMIADGYQDKRSLERRIRRWRPGWPSPSCWKPTATPSTPTSSRSTSMNSRNPVLCCPNDPDDAKFCPPGGRRQDRRSLHRQSCMTNIGHFRAASKLLEGPARHSGQTWVAPADQDGRGRADQRRPLRRVWHSRCPRTEMPGCSLCMGNQAQVREGRHRGQSTSTRNFPTAWARTPTCTWPRPSWRPLRPSWAASHGGRVPGRHGFDQIAEYKGGRRRDGVSRFRLRARQKRPSGRFSFAML